MFAVASHGLIIIIIKRQFVRCRNMSVDITRAPYRQSGNVVRDSSTETRLWVIWLYKKMGFHALFKFVKCWCAPDVVGLSKNSQAEICIWQSGTRFYKPGIRDWKSSNPRILAGLCSWWLNINFTLYWLARLPGGDLYPPQNIRDNTSLKHCSRLFALYKGNYVCYKCSVLWARNHTVSLTILTQYLYCSWSYMDMWWTEATCICEPICDG